MSGVNTTVDLTGGLVDATEDTVATVTLTIPANWNTYNVQLSTSCRIVDSGATTTRLSFYFKRGVGTGGATVRSLTSLDFDSAAANDVVPFNMCALDTAQSSTGSVSYSFTASDDDNDDKKTLDQLSFSVIAIRLT